jgi:dienelactone hydrolase
MNSPLIDDGKTCCPSNSLGYLPEDPNYIIKGQITTIPGPEGDLKAYIVGEGKNAIILIHDIFGMDSGHIKKIADDLSQSISDLVVLVVNFYIDGLPMDDFNENSCCFLPRFICKFLCNSQVKTRLLSYNWSRMSNIIHSSESFLADMKGVNKVAFGGFCWGAYLVFKACGQVLPNDSKIIRCGGISCHPSVSTIGDLFHESTDEIVNAIYCPQLVLSSKNEPNDWQPEGKVSKELNKKGFTIPNEFYTYNQTHGFVARGDLSNSNVARDARDAVSKMIVFLNKIFQ